MKLPQLSVVERLSFIQSFCKGKAVLNLGCADLTRLDGPNLDHHVHLAINKVARRVVGVDLSHSAIEKLAKATGLENLLAHDAEKLPEIADELGKFDIVVAGELIEHLSNPGLMLAGLKSVLASNGILILTTPNAFSLKFFLHNWLRRYDVNSDYHSLVFSTGTLRQLLGRHGFEVEQWAVSLWYHSGIRNVVSRPILKPVFSIFPQLADTLICVARLRGANGASKPANGSYGAPIVMRQS